MRTTCFYSFYPLWMLAEFGGTEVDTCSSGGSYWMIIASSYTHLCWVPQACLQHGQTLQLLCAEAGGESERRVDWKGFCLFCPVLSPLQPLYSLEPVPLEMSEGGTWRGTLPFPSPLRIQWKLCDIRISVALTHFFRSNSQTSNSRKTAL